MNMNDLIKKPATFRVGAKPLSGLAARKQAAALATNEPIEIPAHEMEHRIGIVFDDSGSMGSAQIADAKAGVEEFLRSCEKDKTAVAIYPMNMEGIPLCSNLPAVAVYAQGISATGGTPLVRTANNMLNQNKLTRAIIFSDGSPTGDRDIEKLIAHGVPIDCVYIPDMYVDAHAEQFMQELARNTDGIYLRFERGKSNFRAAFKYLSPGLRYMLADKSFVSKLEGR